MTIWRPDLSNLKGPDYQRLADAIRRDIEAGARFLTLLGDARLKG